MIYRVALVGLSGSGKTTVGRILAETLKIPFVDLDRNIEETCGVSVQEIFSSRGEEHFRILEAKALTGVIEKTGPMVLSPGGGIVLRKESRDLLREHFLVIWLDATPRILAQRLRGDSSRPLLGEDPARDLMQMFEERERFYLEVANHRLIFGNDATESEMVRRICGFLEPGPGD